MSFIGNFAAAKSAKAIGQYNNQLYNTQAQYARKKADMNQKVYDQVTRPILVKNFNKQYSDFFVSTLKSGVEFREGTSPYFNALEFKINQAQDLIISDFNAEMDQVEQLNQSILLAAKGESEAFKGGLTAQVENIKGVGSLLAFANAQNQG